MPPGQTLPPGRMGGTTGRTPPCGRGSRDQTGGLHGPFVAPCHRFTL